MQAFMSYQTADKEVAARVSELFGTLAIYAFMAHEHIAVSVQWQEEILKQIAACDLFVPILSVNYLKSDWCIQESGIAVFRKMTIIALSIDGTLPPAFLSQFQSTKVDPNAPGIHSLLPGLARHNLGQTIDALVGKVGGSGNYRTAEANFALLQPYLTKAIDNQIVTLLEYSAANCQIYDAGLCHSLYLPPLIKSHGKLMNPDNLSLLKKQLLKYNIIV